MPLFSEPSRARRASCSSAALAGLLLGASFAVITLGAASCGSSGHGPEGNGAGGADAGSALDTSPSDDVSPEDVPVLADSSASAPDARDAGDGNVPYPAPHAAPPQALDAGGPVMTAPKVVPIFFASDGQQTQLQSFLTALAASSYWHTVTAEYGVGPLTVGPAIVLSATPPTTIGDAQIQAWLYEQLAAASPGWPAPDANTIYLVLYPDATTVTADFGAGQVEMGCQGFGGYHEEAMPGGGDAGVFFDASMPPDATPPPDAAPPLDASPDGGTGEGGMHIVDSGSLVDTSGNQSLNSFVYAVVPRCAVFGNLIGIDATTSAISHELVEASTDPFVNTNPAYDSVDENHIVWDFAPLAELGDLCAYEPQSFQPLVAGSMVQRIWSNAAAMAGRDPCVPPLSTPYFNTAPVLNNRVVLSSGGQNYATRGVKIPVGQTQMISFQFFSSSPTAAWTVYPEDTSEAFNGPELLSFNPNQFSGKNGDIVTVAVTAVAAGPYGGSEFLLQSLQGNDDSYITYWFGFVQN